ncbi:MAG: molybdopterin-dependent oxidoreductase [Deltaproteobacteria bacterium]|nr:MAG: molybdopterin-dependent oxidoreductase [Deltaproteobacteria bacterium]
MKKRRQFIQLMLRLFAGLVFLFNPIVTGARNVLAKAKMVVLPKETQPESLVNRHPANLDTRNLDLTSLEDFGTMGLSNHQVDLNTWQLIIGGHVQHPMELNFAQITQMLSIEKNVLLICPGVFAYHARWKGISVAKLLEMAKFSAGATHVTFSGPDGRYEKTERFPIEDIRSDKVFLAYGVNNTVLPRKHGFPLRVVAEGYYGNEWVKYVYKVTADKI